jgi:glutathionylspermidine synthase
MRALRDRIGPADAEPVWEAFLLDAIRQAPLPDFLLYGEPYPALNAIVLTTEEHRQIVSLTERFTAIFDKAVAILAEDTAALERMGFPWIAIELLQQEPPGGSPLLGRFDFLLDRQGCWQLLEYNADTPSGARETVRVEPLIEQHLHPFVPNLPAGTAHHLASLLRREFGNALHPHHGETAPLHSLVPNPPVGAVPTKTLGIITNTGYSEDLGQTIFAARLLAPALEPHGIAVVFGDIDNLSLSRGRLRLLGTPLDSLYRYYPFEAMLGHRAFADLFDAVAHGKIHLLNGLRGLLAQNKGVFPWLWQHRDDTALFSPEERDTIQAHLPPTQWISDVPPGQDTAGLVLKQVFGREGEEVYFGDSLSIEDWRWCQSWGSYVVQQRVHADPVPTVIRTSSGPRVDPLWPAIGSFTLRGHWGGYYTRLGTPITTAHAKYAATLCE